MPRYVRNTAILAKIETTYKTDSVPTGAANAMLVSNMSITPINSSNVDRDNVRPFFGGNEELVGTSFVEVSFDVELVGSGTAGVAPAWGALLRGCAFAETLIASTRVDYLPITNALESLTIYYFDDGLLHKLVGARGTVKPMMKIGERPMLSFSFQGIDGSIAAASNPAVTLTAWRVPQVVTDPNTGDVIFGATCSPTGAPALTGGTAYISQGLELDVANALAYTPLLGEDSIDITNRKTTGKVTLDLAAAAEATLMGEVKLATLRSVGMLHGTVTGNRSLIFAPSVQLINPAKVDSNGRRMTSFDMRVLPVSGNDELRIVTSF
jgi:hypothetical protein